MTDTVIYRFISIAAVCVILGIPAVFLVLCIINIVKIIRLKIAKSVVNKSLIRKAIIFGSIFVAIVILYAALFMYMLNQAVEHM